MYKCLKGGNEDDEAENNFRVVPSDRTRGNGRKFKNRRFNLNTGKHFLTVRVARYWNRLPHEVVESF